MAEFHKIGSLGVHPDLQKERDSATFNPDLLTNIVRGGEEKALRRRELLTKLFTDHVFDPRDTHFQSQAEKYDAAVRKGTRLLALGVKYGWDRGDMEVAVDGIRYDVAMGVHAMMFLPVIERLATDEQQEKWLPEATTLRMIGTYAQTELGHGTNLRALQTTATYDASTQEFILDTPLPTGMKWWPGGLGKSANHLILLAQLITKGKKHGMQAFLVQIRDKETHEPLPGVEVGNIGPKLGLHTADNGYLILKNYRIPRTNMLMRHSKVTPEGDFIQSKGSQATYSTMVMVRAHIVGHSAMFICHGATVATRYSAVRRQSEKISGQGEVQILDFQTQQYKLFPNIASGYAVFFSHQYIIQTYDYMYEKELSVGNYTNLPELHSQTCCLKAFTTDLSCEAVGIMRKACGGHGYLLGSGVADILTDSLAGMTYEGENTVLYLQTARYLLKVFSASTGSEKLSSSNLYMRDRPVIHAIHDASDCLNPKVLAAVLKTRACFMVKRAADNFQSALAAGKIQDIAWDDNAVSLVVAAKAHADSFVALNFLEQVEKLEAHAEIKDVLSTLSKLHALHRIVESSGEFIESGAISAKQMELVRLQELTLLPIIRPNAVSLVDAFDFHDLTLNSTLGSYDGQCYQRLLEHAQRDPLNKEKVHPAYFKYIKPLQNVSLAAKL